MTCQAHRSPAPALEADARAFQLLVTSRLQNLIDERSEKLKMVVTILRHGLERLNKPKSEIAELEAILRWNATVRDRLLAMADECDKEFATLDENVRDEAEQALGS